MEWSVVITAVVSLILGIAGTLFGDKYNEARKLGKLMLEILEDKEITQEQQETIVSKVRKIFGRD